MNILMMTNTFTPHVGGVARSVQSFSDAFRAMGRRVVVVAPEFDDLPEDEEDVIRMPAIQQFNGSDFSLPLPMPGLLESRLGDFRPDVIHSHHPFLLGGTAVRIAQGYGIPLIFTHHTMYEQYTHYVPGDSPRMKDFAINLSTGYANLCDRVIAPSESVAEMLRDRGVTTTIASIPTGVDVEQFARGDGAAFRRAHGVPAEALVVGYLGRLAPEKNLGFLAGAVAAMLKHEPRAWFVVIGGGPSAGEIREICERMEVADRLCPAGSKTGRELVDAYHAMDVFAFASKSETQGMVLAEAMAAGVPVIALDAPGAREVVADERNGRLLPVQDHKKFVEALQWFAALPAERRAALREAARETAGRFSIRHCAGRALAVYEEACRESIGEMPEEPSLWETAIEELKAEWELLCNVAGAAAATLEAAGIQDDEDADD